MPDARDKVEEFDEDINTTAPQDKPAVWTMPAPVFRKTSGRLPKDFEKRDGAAQVPPQVNGVVPAPEPKPKSQSLKILVVVLALAGMVGFLIVFLSVVYFFFLRGGSEPPPI